MALLFSAMNARIALFFALLSSCADPSEPGFPALEAGCQPLYAGSDCYLPYPSDFFLADDVALPSGARVLVPEAAALRTDDGQLAELSMEYDFDGYSRIPLIVAYLPDPDGVSIEGLTSAVDDIATTLDAKSSTLIIDAETGELVPHFVDVDRSAYEPDQRSIALHPMVPLRETSRYVVALQGLRDESGALATAPQGFVHLRDESYRGAPALEAVAEYYENQVFPVLNGVGVNRKNLQLAWAFTTGSDRHVLADMWKIREMTLDWLDSNESEVEIASVSEHESEEIWRQVEGTFRVPLFLDSDMPGAALLRDAGGGVMQSGTAAVPFLVHIPASVRDSGGPARFLPFGHGFFGSRFELAADRTRTLMEGLGMIAVAIDWWGMSSDDLPAVIDNLAKNPAFTMRFIDRVHQSMANWMVLTTVLPELAEDAAFSRPAEGAGSGGGELAGEPLVDLSTEASFLGISQGHILGSVLAALHPDLERVVLNVGGAGITHMMFRAEPFSGFMGLASRNFQRPISRYRFIAATQRLFDAIDPALHARYLLEAPLEGATPRRVLLQAGLADTSVPNYASFLHARALSLPVVGEGGRSVYGLESSGEAHESGLSIYDFGLSDEFYRDPEFPSEITPVHQSVRTTEAAIEQMRRFLSEGMVEVTCDGPCDPN